MQVLLRNPLADPYILGVSGGASFAALFGMTIGIGATLLPALAWAGALLIGMVSSMAQTVTPPAKKRCAGRSSSSRSSTSLRIDSMPVRRHL